jgi:hypothetical protein
MSINNKHDSLELIALGKQLQEQAMTIGVKCPEYTSAFCLRFAAKAIHLLLNGPRPTKEHLTITQDDLYTLKKISEGDLQSMFDKLITQLEKVCDLVEQKKMMTAMDGTPIYSDAEYETVKQSRQTLYNARKMNVRKIS